ncbi:MAG: amino acid ABC transporter permease [Oscillospiraceae bacterium]
MLETMGVNIIKIISRYWALFLEGTKYTLFLAFVTVLFGAILGSLIAMVKMSHFKPLSFLGSAYIEIIRGTPLLLQLYFFYFLLPTAFPSLTIFNNKIFCISVALILNSAAYVSEIVRSGIQAVDKGQREASESLGIKSSQTMIRIILPQAIKNILPSLGNEFVAVIKETSLASTFFVGDLMTQYKTINTALYLVIEPLIVVGVIYFILTFTLSKLIALLERRLKAGD